MKKYYAGIAGCFLMLAIAGCGTAPKPAAVPAQSVPAASSAAVPAEKDAVLTLYLPSDDGMRVRPVTRTVTAKEKTLKNALFQMIQLDRQQKYPILPTGLSVKEVYVDNGTATINFSKELKNLSGGTTTETLFVAMVVNTATEFPNVQQVCFQMEGKSIQKLAGHYDMTQPFKRDESLIQMEKK